MILAASWVQKKYPFAEFGVLLSYDWKENGQRFPNPEILARYRVQTASTTGNKLKLVSKQYHFYRQYLKQNVLTACMNTVRWGVSGIRKFS